MKTSRFKSSLLFFASFYAFLLLPLMPLWAQGLQTPSDNLFTPVFQLRPMSLSIRVGESLTIMGSIKNNSGVEQVTLFYRPVGRVNYSSLQMTLQGTSDYSATISAQEISEPTMQYYIKVTHKIGKDSGVGLAGFPESFTVLAPLSPKPPIILTTKKSDENGRVISPKPWYKKWWVWTIAAVLVGGAVAAGGGSGGGSTNNTGTATISAPVP